MTKFTDGTRTIRIEMIGINGMHWERDFFGVGGLEYNEEIEAYIVEDVEYLIEQAEDCAAARGDYSDCEPGETDVYWEEA